MSDACDNDCVAPLRFPRRPGERLATVHGENCSCCAPSARVSADNRPALPHFNYRSGTYGTIREWLLHQVNQSPGLRHWTHRAPDDPAIALLEGASMLGDILTFYQETYANEAFLRTAQWRDSISDLVRLSGYRLSPAVGGNATFAFEIKKDEPVVVPAGFALKATLAEIPAPATFETREESTAYPWLNRFNLFKPLEDGDILATTTEFYITYPEQLLQPIDLKIGDRLLVGDPDLAAVFGAAALPNAEVVIVDSISELHGRKTYKIKGNLKRSTSIDTLVAFRLGRSFHHQGHNGPANIVDPSKPISSTTRTTAQTNSSPAKTETSTTIPRLLVPLARPIRTDTGVFSNPAISLSIRDVEFPLDLEVQDIPGNVAMIIQTRIASPGVTDIANYSDFQTLIRTVRRVDPIAITWGAISGVVSKVTVSGPISDSIGDGDPILAQQALDNAELANEEATQALADAAAARTSAQQARADADNAIAAAAAADADMAAKTSEFATADAKATNLAVAAAIAASALKDGPTDAAAQAAVVKAQDALTAANQAQSSTNTAATVADVKADEAETIRDFTVAADFLALGPLALTSPPLAAATLALANGYAFRAAAAERTVSNEVNAAKAKVDDAQTKAVASKVAVDAVAAAAAEDADARRRSELADQAASDAKDAADLAAGALALARGAAALAHYNEAIAKLTADGREKEADDFEALAAIAVETAAIKEAAKLTRMYIGDALFHEVTTPLFTLKRAKKEIAATTGNKLNFYGTVDEVEALESRRIMLQKDGEPSELVRVSSVDTTSATGTEALRQLHEITLPANVSYADFSNTKPRVTVFGNVVDANEGRTLPEVVLGSGDASAVFQNFRLPKAPLTHHLVAGNTPAETPEIAVYVGGREWQRVDSLFGRGADERVYIVREDAAGNSWVQFGDGKTGARLTNGVNNVTAVQRMGAGAFGPLKEDTKVQAVAKLKNFDQAQMLDVVTGGAPPESGDNAREAAPGKVQSLGRMVSLQDFEREAAAIPGVARASAAWQLEDNVPAVVVSVLMDTGRAAERLAVRDIIIGYNTQRGAGRTAIEVLEGRRMHVTVSVQYALQPGYRSDLVEPQIRRALGVNTGLAVWQEDQTGLFSLRRRRFGGSEYASSIEGITQNVEGVLWAKAVTFAALADTDAPADLPLPTGSVLEPVVTCDAQHVLSLFDAHLSLTAVMALGS
ncbi:hypothetical protein HLB44_32575 [Aquincola sp. S2]|uniref:Baseplate protein J-like domain-containing protein n=1 Tax=Pseudaquabacterium terrae TaxID=2732868 RepID=A0ABX2ESQ8_9BURK|nr:hypothetical protein [Aquabacterium terrae]NRF71734.1 hypothetical protein [Aquabacterium terrae]